MSGYLNYSLSCLSSRLAYLELLYSYGLLCGHYNNPRRGEMWSILHTSVLGTKNIKKKRMVNMGWFDLYHSCKHSHMAT